jgi:lauroyl/myristoyl acyltransferase
MKLFIKKILILFMWYPLRITISFLPLTLVAIIGRTGGRILHLLSREKQRVMMDEFRRILPGKSVKELRVIVRDSFINYSCSELEVLLYPSMNKEFIDRVVTIEGKEHLDAALAGGRGVLLFQAHFGAFQMTMPAIGYNGYTMNQISASAAIWKEGTVSTAQSRMLDIKAQNEYTLPVKHISVTSSLRPAYHALERNEIVGITVDGGGGKRITALRFLGREAYFQTGAVDIAMSTKAAIVPAFVMSEPGLSHRLVLCPPLQVHAELGKNDNRRRVMQEFAALLESRVLRHPQHYGYTLCLRSQRAQLDAFPFFSDYSVPVTGKSGSGSRAAKDSGQGVNSRIPG